jgi:hypothetical protein
MITDDDRARWIEQLSAGFLVWASVQRRSKGIRITAFDPEAGIRKVFYEAGSAQLDTLLEEFAIGYRFDLRSPEAEAWIKEYSGQQIKYISATNRAAIQQIKLIAFQQGMTIPEQRKLIKQYIGLLPQHVVAINRYEEGLRKSGMDSNAVDKLTEKYRKKLLNYRANMIGVTEGMAASNEGIRSANEDAMRRGILPADKYEQVWLASGLKNTCDQCMAANGTTAPIGGTFPNGSRGPPIHPHDHCTVVIRRK